MRQTIPNPVLPVRLFLAMLAVLALSACGDDSGGDGAGGEVEAPFEPFSPTTVATLSARLPSGESPAGTVRIVGQKELNGRTFDSYKVALDPAHPENGIEIWIDKEDEATFTFQGFEEPGVMAVVADQPYTIRTDGPVDVGETIVFEATSTSVESGTSLRGSATIEYIKKSDDVTVETAFGTLSGAKHFAGTVTLEGEAAPPLLTGIPLEVEMWYHPSFGVVKSELPLLQLGLDMKGEESCGEFLTPGMNTIQKVGVVEPGGEPFRLATYDCSGTFNADKMTHAKMLLEVRFADEEMAKTTTQPPVIETFGTVMGYFPSLLLSSPVSIFHPEENGKGYTFWYALVDEAARNAAGDNGISYRIEVAPADFMTNSVRATARIRYKVIEEP